MQHHHSVDASNVFNGPLGAELRAQLANHENVQAVLPVDLTVSLRFAQGLLVLTESRIVGKDADGDWQSWPWSADLKLRLMEHAGVGTLELHNASQRLALWRFTLGQQAEVVRFLLRFEQLRDAAAAGTLHSGWVPVEESRCSVCGEVLPPDSDECPACARQAGPKTSTWVLLRVGRFAKPYKGLLILGFVLTLLSTAATLVPPYLTIPLMDDILIPYQSGQPIDPHMVGLCLGGLLLSALLA